MDVHGIHFAGMDPLRSLGIGLIEKAQLNAACHGECAVEFGACGSTSKNGNLKLLAMEMGVRSAVRLASSIGTALG
jgi:hypothetical protein